MQIRTQSVLLTLLVAGVYLGVSFLTTWHLLGMALRTGVKTEIEEALSHASRAPLEMRQIFVEGLAREVQLWTREDGFLEALVRRDRQAIARRLDPGRSARFRVDQVRIEPLQGEKPASSDARGRWRDLIAETDRGRFRITIHVLESKEMAQRQERLGRIHRTYSALAQGARTVRQRMLITHGLILLVSLVLVLAATWRMAHRVLGRLERLIDATRQVARGDLTVSIRAQRADEIGALEAAFDGMTSELRQSRDRIGSLERIAAWREVARRLAHEIKNPLTPVRLIMQEVKERYQGEDPEFLRLLQTASEIVDEEVGSLHRLVEDFSSLAKDLTPRMEPVDLGALWREYAQHLAEVHPGVRIRQHIPEGLPWIDGDRTLIRRVFANLVLNAQEATGGACRIEVHLRSDDAERALELRLRDHGPGVPPEGLQRIFEPYYSGKSGGTGLGLAITRKIMMDHGGNIQARLPEGGGLEMILRWPRPEGDPDVGTDDDPGCR